MKNTSFKTILFTEVSKHSRAQMNDLKKVISSIVSIIFNVIGIDSFDEENSLGSYEQQIHGMHVTIPPSYLMSDAITFTHFLPVLIKNNILFY